MSEITVAPTRIEIEDCNLKRVKFTYTNWQGETATRHVIPLRIWFGTTPWHPEPQWLLEAFDTVKMARRDFAVRDIKDWGKDDDQAPSQNAADGKGDPGTMGNA
jgi:predicted DNA-binding transcriptional regulator YafY